MPSDVNRGRSGDPDPRSTPGVKRRTRNVPPLAWIVIVLLVVIIAVAIGHWNATYRTPSGGTAPMAANGHTVMPAAPSQNGAPATPPSQS